MSATALAEYMEGLAAAQRNTPARVEAIPHPDLPLTTLYRITGSPMAIRAAVWRLQDSVDAALGGKPGRAVFSEPRLDGDTYVALGQVTLLEPREGAAS